MSPYRDQPPPKFVGLRVVRPDGSFGEAYARGYARQPLTFKDGVSVTTFGPFGPLSVESLSVIDVLFWNDNERLLGSISLHRDTLVREGDTLHLTVDQDALPVLT